MIKYLDQLDKELLIALNSSGSEYWDSFMWLVTGKIAWVPTALVFIYMLFKPAFKSGNTRAIRTASAKAGLKEGLLALLMLVLTVVICDQISSSFFKPFFERLRPSREPELDGLLTLVNGYKGGKYGFVSSHAANSVGFAVFISLLFKKRWLSLFVFAWAVTNSYSRLYMGVHYPGDVLIGAMIGIAVAYLMYYLYFTIHRRLYYTSYLMYAEPIYDREDSRPAVFILCVTFIIIAVISPFMEFYTTRPL